MSRLTILDKKRIKQINGLIKKQWGSDFDLTDYVVFANPKNKLFIINRDVDRLDFRKLRINSLGLYFGEIKNRELRLSVEGAQFVAETADKNILNLNKKQAKQWMSGQDFEIDSELEGFAIIKYEEDILGCGKLVRGKLLNYVPKERRI
ncbi:hypothetical protein JW930_03495 [Candidatus Woesearchaeota archaeon]|nr:hypothetical protein [Candidatus Woesearchaeota archaeon]